jgi:hypothetical protein
MLTKRGLEDINDEIVALAHRLGWSGEVTVQAVDFPIDGTLQSSSAWYPDGINIGVSSNLDEESALKRAKAQFIHAMGHDPKFTRGGAEYSHPVEEAMTYLKGSEIAKEVGVGNEFDALGKYRISEFLAEAEAKHRGEDTTEEDTQKAKAYVEKYGIKKTIIRLKEIVPYGEYPLGYEGERLRMIKKRATSMVIPAFGSVRNSFRKKNKRTEDTLIESQGG